MAPPCEFQICLLIGQENVYLRREIAKALPIGQDVPPCTLHSSFFEGVNKRFPLKRQPKINTSLAAPGAPKWPTGSGKGSTLGFWALPSTFSKGRLVNSNFRFVKSVC